MRITTCLMSLSVGLDVTSIERAFSMEAPAAAERPDAAAAPAPRARPPFKRLRRLRPFLALSRRARRRAAARSSRSFVPIAPAPRRIGAWPGSAAGPALWERKANGSLAGEPGCRSPCSRAGHVQFALAALGRRPGGGHATPGQDDVVDDPVVPGLLGGHVVVAVDVLRDLLDGAAGVVGDDLGHPVRQGELLA